MIFVNKAPSELDCDRLIDNFDNGLDFYGNPSKDAADYFIENYLDPAINMDADVWPGMDEGLDSEEGAEFARSAKEAFNDPKTRKMFNDEMFASTSMKGYIDLTKLNKNVKNESLSNAFKNMINEYGKLAKKLFDLIEKGGEQYHR